MKKKTLNANKTSRLTGQISSKLEPHSVELQLTVPTQRNKSLQLKILPVKVAQYQHKMN